MRVTVMRCVGDRKSREAVWSWRRCLGMAVLGVLVSEGVLVAQGTHTVVTERVVDAKTPVVKKEFPGQQGKQIVSISVKDSSLSAVLNMLARQVNTSVLYDKGLPGLSKKISVHIVNANVMDAFAEVLKGTGLSAGRTSDGETIVIRVASELKPQSVTETGSITGRVVDSASGEGVAGVTVTVPGLNLTVVTGRRGEFTLAKVPVGERVVTFRLLGYVSESRTVRVVAEKEMSVRVVFKAAATMLSGIVTTATGQQRRMEIGNDITTVNADSVMAVAPVATVTDLLATRVPGLMVLPSSGLPGAPSRLRLRGTSSLSTSNDPIVVIDGVRMYADQSGDKGRFSTGGVANGGGAEGGSSLSGGGSGPSPLDQLDPNSIATIEVFKGPSASAMYGPDAANGVIMITTKRGQSGPPRVDISLTAGRTTLQGDWPVNYYRFGHGIQSSTLGNEYGGGSRICSAIERCVVDSVVAFQALHSSRLSPLEVGRDRGISLGVSGGRQTMTYALTGSVTDRNGILRLPPFEVERFASVHNLSAPAWMRQPDTYLTAAGSGKVGLQVGTRSDVTMTTTTFYSKQQQPPDLAGVIAGLSTRYFDVTNTTPPDLLFGYLQRILFHSLRTTNTVQGIMRLTEWLPVNLTGGVDVYTTDNNAVRPRGYGLGYRTPASNRSEGDTTGTYSLARGRTLIRTLDISTVIPVPRVQVRSGVNYSAISRTSFSASTIGLPFGVMEPTQFIYQSGLGPSQAIESRSTFGWYVAPTLQLTSRLFFNPGFRLDGSSTTGVRAGLSGLPKIDVSWLAVDRSERAPLFGVLTLLRPRIAIGTATVQPRAGNSLRLFTPTSVVPRGATTAVTIASMTSLGNTQLRPERSREVEAGFEGDLWNSRVTVAVSGYQKMRYDAIVTFATAASVGGSNIAANIGTIRNRGINASFGARVLDSRALSWNVDATLTQNRGMVVSLLGGEEQVRVDDGCDGVSCTSGRGAIVFRPGYPPNAIFVPRIASYFDANGDGRIGRTEVVIANDSVYMGSQEPSDQLDLRTGITVLNGQLQLSTALSYQHGMTQYNEIGLGALEGLNDPSIPLGRQAEIMAACVNSVCGGSQQSSQIGAYQRINLIRWQSVSVNWHVPRALAARAGGSAMTVALQGSNLGLRTNYRGKDPAVSKYGTGNLVADSGQLPAPRVFQLRLTWQR